jgi:DNA polymerase-1
MIPLAWDTETALIRPGLLAPPLVCVSYQRPGFEPKVQHWTDARPLLQGWLDDPNTLLVGHFVAYDAAVICAQFPELVSRVFAAYRAGRVTCTKKRQQLLDIAGGVYRGRPGANGKWIPHKYHLEELSRRHLGRPMQKDGWRLSYAEFRDAPIAQWPERARELQVRARVRLEELRVKHQTAQHPTKGTVVSDEDEAEIRNMSAIVADVPEGVIRYPLDDATATLGVYLAQEQHAEFLKDQYRQAYADFVLYLSAVWGLRTNAAGVDALEAELVEAHAELKAELQAAGLVREDGTRDMKAVKRLMIEVCREKGLTIRRTDAHSKCELGDACEEHVSLDADACEAAAMPKEADGAPVTALEASEALGEDDKALTLAKYAELVTLSKMLSNDVKMLRAGTTYPVHTRYDIAETGRTTSSNPNIQNLNTGRIKNRNSTAQRLRPGVRQAFVPRPGKVFFQADYPQLELYTLAQCCKSWLGYSALGDALNQGLDPHLAVAAKIVGCSYEEAAANKKRHDIDHARQVGKVFNFGKPGGLGNAKLTLYARKAYGVTLTLEQCEAYTAQWHETFPEMRAYFARVNALFGEGVERATVTTLFTERHRGGATYCAACNNGFQALGVDCAKAGLCLVAEAEYCDTDSPLYGSRTVAFVHDELIGETDDGPGAHDAAVECARLMVTGANRYLPDVPIAMSKMEPTLMRAWSKDAKQVFLNGRLVPWAPEARAA